MPEQDIYGIPGDPRFPNVGSWRAERPPKSTEEIELARERERLVEKVDRAEEPSDPIPFPVGGRFGRIPHIDSCLDTTYFLIQGDIEEVRPQLDNLRQTLGVTQEIDFPMPRPMSPAVFGPCGPSLSLLMEHLAEKRDGAFNLPEEPTDPQGA